MDTFMDKLAHRFNAQEMIKANASAEAAETARLKEQNAMYEEMLQKVQDSSVLNETNAVKLEQSAENISALAEKLEQSVTGVAATAERTEQGAALVGQSADKLEQGVVRVSESAAKVEQGAVRVEELVATAIAKIEEMQAGAQNTEELNALLEELKNVQSEKFEALTDHVHKENVKVYRNVQAVVVDELAKSVDLLGKQQESASKKVTIVMILSLVTLLLSAAGVALQILMYLNII